MSVPLKRKPYCICMSDEETRDVVDNVKKALQEKVSDKSANPERFIVSCIEGYIH